MFLIKVLMRRKPKKHILLPSVLLLYIAVLAYISFPRYKESGNWKEYIIVLGISVLLAVSLFFLLKQKQKIRDRFNQQN